MPPLEHRVTGAGVTLAVYEWHPHVRGRGATIFLAHATGFHSRCWDRPPPSTPHESGAWSCSIP
jgi:hypothetical protein